MKYNTTVPLLNNGPSLVKEGASYGRKKEIKSIRTEINHSDFFELAYLIYTMYDYYTSLAHGRAPRVERLSKLPYIKRRLWMTMPAAELIMKNKNTGCKIIFKYSIEG